MAEKKRDAEDRLLDSTFDFTPIADDGFSDRIVRRIRRHIWVQRLSLPVAMLIGAAIAIKPLMQLVSIGTRLLGAVSQELPAVPVASIIQLPVLIITVVVLAIGMLSVRMLEE